MYDCYDCRLRLLIDSYSPPAVIVANRVLELAGGQVDDVITAAWSAVAQVDAETHGQEFCP
ncbi:hypothetical protein CHU95_02255 [Niveispirillum lacus]|uniref:Uncharacterized protein n=1 Tax=Niveispirillum lacus TaxID=1981099 RepID=A0A255Z6Z3_9PROT|nr:hypothetical protein CHU95_02255 [Niveispirillum lacus]